MGMYSDEQDMWRMILKKFLQKQHVTKEQKVGAI